MLLTRKFNVLAILACLALSVSVPAQAQTFTVIYNFSGATAWMPSAGLTRDSGGNLYGTAADWGSGPGGAFELKARNGNWVFDGLFKFNGSNGAYPGGEVIFGPDGALYSTTYYGGNSSCAPYGCGVVYKLTPPPASCKTALCYWTETILYQFTGGSDGEEPAGGLVFDQAGNLYGTSLGGGTAGMGTVYELSPSNDGWTEKVLYSFAGGSDGAAPLSGVTLDSAGNLYGTTTAGGNAGCGGEGCGTVFEVSPVGSGWAERVLKALVPSIDGEQPRGGLTFDAAGNLYGSTFLGGAGSGGTVFELSPSGGGWSFSVLSALPGPGGGPTGNLAEDATGDLYGITFTEGSYSLGSVFKLTRGQGNWTYTLLHSFRDDGGGYWPDGSPLLDPAGTIYGTTTQGGSNLCGFETYCGVAWEIVP